MSERAENRIVIASDHAGFPLKERVKKFLISSGLTVDDLGTHDEQSVDYPDYGSLAAAEVSAGRAKRGILICGTGIGMSIVANRYPRVRAALCMSIEMARLAREHNDANIVVLAGRLLAPEVALEIVNTWLTVEFQAGRHLFRIEKIDLQQQ